MFDRLKSIFKGKDSAKTPLPPKAETKAPAKPEEKSKADKGKAPEGKGTTKPQPRKTPEELCGITPKMSKDEIREKLALLYKRYNRATSSLDTVLRAEAEEMLDAIVAIREKVFGPI